MDWSGFTDEELQKINDSTKQPSEPSQNPPKIRPKSARHAKNPARGPVVGPKGPIVGPASLSNPSVTSKEKQEEFLSQIKKENGHVTRTRKEDTTVKQEAEVDDENPFKPDSPEPSTAVTPALPATPQPEPTGDALSTVEPAEPPALKPEQPAKPVNMSRLEELQLAQCELEEKNKQREKELSKTISDKFAATAEQARLLSNLKHELASVEQSITSDICILRDRIDHSNRTCYDARKRFELAEVEYVASKLALHNAEERKEGLQEHLFTIIQMNETKKSQKLEELMSKLEHAGISSPPPT